MRRRIEKSREGWIEGEGLKERDSVIGVQVKKGHKRS